QSAAAGRRHLQAIAGGLVRRQQPAPAAEPRGLSRGFAQSGSVSLAGAARRAGRRDAPLGARQPALDPVDSPALPRHALALRAFGGGAPATAAGSRFASQSRGGAGTGAASGAA